MRGRELALGSHVVNGLSTKQRHKKMPGLSSRAKFEVTLWTLSSWPGVDAYKASKWSNPRDAGHFTKCPSLLFEMKIVYTKAILSLLDLPSHFPKLRSFACSGPPFVIRGVLIGWG